MRYLVDTNIISELTKARPSLEVTKWFASIPDKNLYLSVLTIGEIRKGISKIPDIKKKERVITWLEQDLTMWFMNRMLPISLQVADKWGVVQAQSKRTLPVIDSLIAATALHFNLILVTRNTKDFQHLGLQIVNPFSP